MHLNRAQGILTAPNPYWKVLDNACLFIVGPVLSEYPLCLTLPQLELDFDVSFEALPGNHPPCLQVQVNCPS